MTTIQFLCLYLFWKISRFDNPHICPNGAEGRPEDVENEVSMLLGTFDERKSPFSDFGPGSEGGSVLFPFYIIFSVVGSTISDGHDD